MLTLFSRLLLLPFIASLSVLTPLYASPIESAQIDHNGFVNNKTCVTCHAEEAKQWKGSHHQQAMQTANEQTVLGDFKDVTFTDSGVSSLFFKKEGRFFVNTLDANGVKTDFEVKYTFGVKPLQQYLLALPKGRFQAYTVAWDTEKKHWFSLYPNEKIASDNLAHWTSRAFTANSSCIECHTTNMSLNHDADTGEYKSHWSEENVSCQSCHGPGENHLKWAEQADKDKKSNKGLIVNYKTLSSKEQVETCARCHSRRYSVSENDAHGRSFFDDFMPELLNEGIYHADGQVLEEDYVYGSFIQSKMHQKGVACMDCHNPHSLTLRKPGNALCTTCHQTKPPKDKFVSLTAKHYDSEDHHFHKVGSTGAQCVNCHMPEKTYMQVDPRRDHSFSIPRPDLSEKWGVPNACTSCHQDKQNTWAISAMDKWFSGTSWQQRPNIVGTISKARLGSAEAFIPLVELIKDVNQADIIRATGLSLIPQYGAKGQATLIEQLNATSPLLRATALRGLGTLHPQQRIKVVSPLLTDTIQSVRIEAASVLANLPKSFFDDAQWKNFEVALAQYKSAQLAQSDHPEGHLNLGNLYAIKGQADLAEKSYRTAIKKDPYFLPAYTNLAHFYYQTGNKKEAEKTFRQAIKQRPKEGSSYYSLALLLTEQKNYDEALTLLKTASELQPNNFSTLYNYGLLLQRMKKLPEATLNLEKALALAPNNKRALKALIALYQQQGEKEKVMSLVKQYSQPQ